jgi:peptidoglycan/xylan/chitin deacetylase (PgdA/CDA1 family)
VRARAARAAAALVFLAGGLWGLYAWIERPASDTFGSVVCAGTGRRVALTFDDGPNPAITPRILAALRERRVHATFFLVGRAVQAHPDLVRRLAADGHEIENHTLSHAHLNALLTRAALVREIGGGRDALVAAGVRAPRFTRPPFGLRDYAALDTIRALGMQPVLWSAMLGDYAAPPPPAQLLRTLLANVRDGAIIVLHDGDRGRDGDGGRTYEAALTGPLIDALRARGYALVTLDQLVPHA